MVAWKKTYGEKGTVETNTGSLFQPCNKLVGDEIFLDTEADSSYISLYFLNKWHSRNKDTEAPMTLGQEFFRYNNWIVNIDGIDTPYGRLYLHRDTNRLDTDLADKIFTVETVINKKQKGTSRDDQIKKLHKYFGHCHADSLWRIIRQSSNQEGFTQAEIEKICGECHNCQLSKRKSPRKKTSLPRSSSFNEVVTMDLKCFGDRTYILWMVDDATRLIRGQVIQDKEPDTIIAAIQKIWINGYGMGPGLPSKAFYSDNGGEFVNQKLLNLCQAQGIILKTTSSYSPQQNGLNERNHGLVDIMVEKIRRDYPQLTMQEAVNEASFAKNCIIHQQGGFSAFQLVFGRNPGIPGVSDCTTGGLEQLSDGEITRGIFDRMNKIITECQEKERDWRYKTALKANLPSTTDVIMELGDQVVYKDGKDGRRYDARIVGFDGPNAILKRGNMDRRAPTAELLPSFAKRQEIPEAEEITSRIQISESDSSDTEIIDEILPRRRGPRRKRKPEIISEISEKKVVRTSKRRAEPEETDDEITPEIWSEDEDTTHLRKNLNLTRPKLGENIKAWNEYGEEFSGTVIQHHAWRKREFKIREHGTLAELWVDLNKLNLWQYTEKSNPEEEEEGDKLGYPSLNLLNAGTIHTEEHAFFMSCCIENRFYT